MIYIYINIYISCRKKPKVSQHNGIDDWQFTLIDQCETHEGNILTTQA